MPQLRNAIDKFLDRRLPVIPHIEPTTQDRIELCRRHGDFSVAYSTAVQPGLRYFGDKNGYIAYAVKMGHVFVLGDPVALPSQRADYIRRFVACAKAPCFVQISNETANILEKLGYRINHMGIDTSIDLETHQFAGKKNETVRYSERWLLKKNYSLVECDGTVTNPQEIQNLSKDWHKGKIVNRREMCFLNRPFPDALMPHMRRFAVLDFEAKPVAVLDFDPIFKDDRVIGYTTAFKRKLTGATSHAEIGLTKFAADRFRGEGHKIMTLGLSPLAAIERSGFTESRIWRNLFARAYKSKLVNSKIFNLQGQAAFKRRFHGNEHATYIGLKRGRPMEMLALLRLLKTL